MKIIIFILVILCVGCGGRDYAPPASVIERQVCEAQELKAFDVQIHNLDTGQIINTVECCRPLLCKKPPCPHVCEINYSETKVLDIE